jgi:hypothetical protein
VRRVELEQQVDHADDDAHHGSSRLDAGHDPAGLGRAADDDAVDGLPDGQQDVDDR